MSKDKSDAMRASNEAELARIEAMRQGVIARARAFEVGEQKKAAHKAKEAEKKLVRDTPALKAAAAKKGAEDYQRRSQDNAKTREFIAKQTAKNFAENSVAGKDRVRQPFVARTVEQIRIATEALRSNTPQMELKGKLDERPARPVAHNLGEMTTVPKLSLREGVSEPSNRISAPETFSPAAQGSDGESDDTPPSGTVVMFHLWSGESLSTFFDTTTGLGKAGRWSGWALCDGNTPNATLGATPNMGTKFPAGFDHAASPDTDYTTIGSAKAGVDNGYKWHGDVLELGNRTYKNNHAHHSLRHRHYDGVTFSTPPTDCAATGTGAYAWPVGGGPNPVPTVALSDCMSWSGYDGNVGNQDYDAPIPEDLLASGGSTDEWTAKHDGPFNSGTACDNRPPFYVIYFAIKL